MQEKAKHKPKRNMSRRRFLQVGIATATVGIGAAAAAQWANSSSKPPTSEIENCAYTWAASSYVVNEEDTALLWAAIQSHDLNPSDAAVYGQAMEYKTCYDADNHAVSSELLSGPSVRAAIVFTVLSADYNDETLQSYAQDVQEALAGLENFSVPVVEVLLSNGEENLYWEVEIPEISNP